MKYLFLLFPLILASILVYNLMKPPRFQPGDCVKYERIIESWEDDEEKQHVYQILEVGKEKYLVMTLRPRLYLDTIMYGFKTSIYIDSTDRIYDKVDCKDYLEEKWK